MPEIVITPAEPTPDTLVAHAYASPDYRDAFVIHGCETASIEEFATEYFLAQPRWLATVSMNLRGHDSVAVAVADANYAEGDRVGSWQLHGRADNEIMFGEHMGFMEYRFSMLRHDDGRIEASTTVQYRKRFGSIYFGVVKPFHTRFVQLGLRHAARRFNERTGQQS